MRNPSFWLYLLAIVTFLLIALRRVMRRQRPLKDDVYSKQLALDQVDSGVAKVNCDGLIGSVNPALAKMLDADQVNLIGATWMSLFPASERVQLEEAYRQALLVGRTSLHAEAARHDGSTAHVEIKLVTLYSDRAQLLGHYCLVHDVTRESEFEQQIKSLRAELAASQLPMKPAQHPQQQN